MKQNNFTQNKCNEAILWPQPAKGRSRKEKRDYLGKVPKQGGIVMMIIMTIYDEKWEKTAGRPDGKLNSRSRMIDVVDAGGPGEVSWQI